MDYFKEYESTLEESKDVIGLLSLLQDPFLKWTRTKTVLSIDLPIGHFEIFYKEGPFEKITFWIDGIRFEELIKEECFLLASIFIQTYGSTPIYVKMFPGFPKKIPVDKNLLDSVKERIRIRHEKFRESFSNSYFKCLNPRSRIRKVNRPKKPAPKVIEDSSRIRSFGTIGDRLSEKIVLKKKHFVPEEDLYANIENPSRQLSKKKKVQKEYDTLILWDYENVNFIKDVPAVEKAIKKYGKAKKIVFVYKKHKSDKARTLTDFEGRRKQLADRGWTVSTSKKTADDELINSFHRYKEKVSRVVLISRDIDFKGIIEEFNPDKVEIIVHGTLPRNSWVRKYPFQII